MKFIHIEFEFKISAACQQPICVACFLEYFPGGKRLGRPKRIAVSHQAQGHSLSLHYSWVRPSGIFLQICCRFWQNRCSSKLFHVFQIVLCFFKFFHVVSSCFKWGGTDLWLCTFWNHLKLEWCLDFASPVRRCPQRVWSACSTNIYTLRVLFAACVRREKLSGWYCSMLEPKSVPWCLQHFKIAICIFRPFAWHIHPYTCN